MFLVFLLPVIGECRVKKCGGKDVVHSCSNIAYLNTGVSLHSSPVLKVIARHFVGYFAICSKYFKRFALGVQCRCLDINSSQGRFRKCGKILEKKKKNSGNLVGKPSEPSRNQVKRIINNK